MSDFSGLLGKFVVARRGLGVGANLVAGEVVGVYVDQNCNLLLVLVLLRPTEDWNALAVVPLVTAKTYGKDLVAAGDAYDEISSRC